MVVVIEGEPRLLPQPSTQLSQGWPCLSSRSKMLWNSSGCLKLQQHMREFLRNAMFKTTMLLLVVIHDGWMHQGQLL